MIGIFIIFLFLIIGGVSAATPISNCQELQNMQNDLEEDYYLTKDINCSSISKYIPIGFRSTSQFVQSKPFNGVLDGKGHIIKNLGIIHEGYRGTGIFGFIGANGKVRNLGLIDITIGNDGSYVGSLAGINHGTIENCFVKRLKAPQNTPFDDNIYSTGDNENSYVGGIVGENAGTIKNCYVKDIVVTGKYRIGGLVGYNVNPGKIINSYSTAKIVVIPEGTSGGKAGGVVGTNGQYSPSQQIGGEVKNSFAVGPVGCRNFESCAKSSIGGPNTGGLIGELINSHDILNNYWYDYPTTSPIYGNDDTEDVAIYCIRYHKSSSTPECTQKDLSYFKGSVKNDEPFKQWNFENIWIEITNDFPELRWERQESCENLGGYCELLRCRSGFEDLGKKDCGWIHTCCKEIVKKETTKSCEDLGGYCSPSTCPADYDNIGEKDCGSGKFCCVEKEGETPTTAAGCGAAAGKTFYANVPHAKQEVINTGACVKGNIGPEEITDIKLDGKKLKWDCEGSDRTITCEANYQAGGTPSVEPEEGNCGNGVLDTGEQCDGVVHCDNNCFCEEGYLPTFMANECVPDDITLLDDGCPFDAEKTSDCDEGADFEVIVYTPDYMDDDCQGRDTITMSYYCPAPLSFFNWMNLVAAIIVIGLVYFIVESVRKKK